MRRILSGSLEHLAPTALLRLVSATSPSGVLELDTADGSLRLEVDRGRVKMPSRSELASAGRILACRRGEFRFSPHGVPPHEGEVLSLTAFAEAAGGAASNQEVDRLLKEELLEDIRKLIGSLKAQNDRLKTEKLSLSRSEAAAIERANGYETNNQFLESQVKVLSSQVVP